MDLSTAPFDSLFFAGAILLLVGAVLYVFPPKKINWWYGYRTPLAMQDQQRWNFAQRFSAIRLAFSGIALLFMSWIAPYAHFDEPTAKTVSFIVLITAVLFVLIATERAIKRKFN